MRRPIEGIFLHNIAQALAICHISPPEDIHKFSTLPSRWLLRSAYILSLCEDYGTLQFRCCPHPVSEPYRVPVPLSLSSSSNNVFNHHLGHAEENHLSSPPPFSFVTSITTAGARTIYRSVPPCLQFPSPRAIIGIGGSLSWERCFVTTYQASVMAARAPFVLGKRTQFMVLAEN